MCVCADGSSLSVSSVSSSITGDISAADYLQRLKVLRARCGLATQADTSSDVTKSHAPVSNVVDTAVSVVMMSSLSCTAMARVMTMVHFDP